MKFITEMELRNLYKTKPFTKYVLEPDSKLTPEARQFLVDRKVTLIKSQASADKNLSPKQSKHECNNWYIKRLHSKMEWIESLFYLIAAELLQAQDAILSEEILILGKYFKNVQTAAINQIALEKFEFWGLSAEELKNSYNVEKYDVNEFHVGLKNGKEITLLNHLRASLKEIEISIIEAYWDEEKLVCTRQDLIDAINLIINILCIMMWKCLGGQKWKR